jgi:hypothetical protein
MHGDRGFHHGIVGQYGGSLAASKDPHSGAVFSLRFPLVGQAGLLN